MSGGPIITATIAGQTVGVPVDAVQEVFAPLRITPVPLAPSAVEGLLTRHGRIYTAISLRRQIEPESIEAPTAPMAMALRAPWNGHALLVGAIGNVRESASSAFYVDCAVLDPKWSILATGVHHLEDDLVVMLNLDAVIGSQTQPA